MWVVIVRVVFKQEWSTLILREDENKKEGERTREGGRKEVRGRGSEREEQKD